MNLVKVKCNFQKVSPLFFFFLLHASWQTVYWLQSQEQELELEPELVWRITHEATLCSFPSVDNVCADSTRIEVHLVFCVNSRPEYTLWRGRVDSPLSAEFTEVNGAGLYFTLCDRMYLFVHSVRQLLTISYSIDNVSIL